MFLPKHMASYSTRLSIPVAARTKAWVCCRSLVGIVGSGLQSRRGHGSLSLASGVCCQVEVSATGWSLVRRSPTECGVSDMSMIVKYLGPCSTTVHRFQQQLNISTYMHSAKLLIGATSLDIPLLFCDVHRQVACEERVSSLMMALVRRNM
jgi:hypothetical protein